MGLCLSRDTFEQYLDEELSLADQESITTHVEACAACQTVLERLTAAADDGCLAVAKLRQGTEDHRPPGIDNGKQFLDQLKRFPGAFTQCRSNDTEAQVRTVPGAPAGPAEWPAVTGYEILGRLGRGGMGVVYKARQIDLDRLVALKMLLAGTHAEARDLARFRREAEAAARLQHPNIVQVYDIGESEGRPYFALELVAGNSLASTIRGEPQPVQASARLVETLARTIHFAHQHGIVHRDLKPANILLQKVECRSQIAEQTGDCDAQSAMCNLESAIPKISDFGLAKRLDGSVGWTQSGEVIGTPGYMAPEQAMGKDRPAGPAADVYALGAILYTLLTGRPPFKAATAFDTVIQVLHDEPVAPGRLRPMLPRDVQTICLKCLEKEPCQRYTSAEALADDLRRFLAGQSIHARPIGPIERGWKWAKRRPALATLLALIGMFVGIGFPGVTALWLWAEQQRQAKELQSQRADEQFAKAEMARTQATTEAQIAKAVNNFLQFDLLDQANPDSHPDRTLTVRAALDRAALRITGRFDEQPLVEAAIRAVIGRAYLSLGEYAAAEPHLVRSLELRGRELGEESLETVTAITSLGQLRHFQGDYKAAEPLLVQVLDRMRQTHGLAHKDTLTAMNNLALLYWAQGNHAQAQPLLAEAVATSRRVYGEEHSLTLTLTLSLAAVFQRQGKYVQAESLLVTVLEARRRSGDVEHPQTRAALATIENLAALYHDQGKHDKAEPMVVKVLDARRRIHGEEHPETLVTLSSLANSYLAQGKYAAAEPLALKGLEARRRAHGQEHPLTLTSMLVLATAYRGQGKNAQAESLLVAALDACRRHGDAEHLKTFLGTIETLAGLYNDQGKYGKAEPLLVELLDARRRVLGEEHPDTLKTVSYLFILYLTAGNYTAAGPLALRILDARRRLLGEEHRDTLFALHDLAVLYTDQGKYAEAEPLYVKTLEAQRRLLGPNSIAVADTLFGLGDNLLQQKRYADAEPVLRECVKIYGEGKRSEDWLRFYAQVLLGRSLEGQQKYAETEPLLVAGYVGIKAREQATPARFKNKNRVASVREAIIQFYEAWGKPEQAAEWRAKQKPPAPARELQP